MLFVRLECLEICKLNCKGFINLIHIIILHWPNRKVKGLDIHVKIQGKGLLLVEIVELNGKEIYKNNKKLHKLFLVRIKVKKYHLHICIWSCLKFIESLLKNKKYNIKEKLLKLHNKLSIKEVLNGYQCLKRI